MKEHRSILLIKKKADLPLSKSAYGGLEGIRTLDPYNANVVRSQLRYEPVLAVRM